MDCCRYYIQLAVIAWLAVGVNLLALAENVRRIRRLKEQK